MLFSRLSLIFSAAAVVLGSPAQPDSSSQHGQSINYFRNGRQGVPGSRVNGECTTTSTPTTLPPPATSDCAISYDDVTTSVVVTQVVEVSQVSTVFTTESLTSSVQTTDGQPTTSWFITDVTVTSTYLSNVTVIAPSEVSGGETPHAYTSADSYPSGNGPSTGAGATSSHEPLPPCPIPSSSNSSIAASTGYPTSVHGSGTTPVPSSTLVSSRVVSSNATSSSSVSSSASSAVPSTSTCPPVWRTIAQQMIGAFTGCNEPARASIRFAFHDAAGFSSKTTPYGSASGGADGSILFNDEEVSRTGNAPLPSARAIFQNFYSGFSVQVSGADFVQFAAVIGVRMCGGPVYKTVVGREDDHTACPDYMMPAAFGANASYEALTSLWADKGIDERELAALIGAHSVSRAFAQQANGIPANSAQDSTPANFDTKYYSETQANVAPSGVYRFDSDINLSNATTVIGQAFKDFAADTDLWRGEYSAAAYKLSVMGLTNSKLASMVDCTSIVEELT